MATDPTYAIVPAVATEEMIGEIDADTAAGAYWSERAWTDAVAVSPSQGRVTQAMLERAAEAYYLAEPWRHNDEAISWLNIGDFARNRRLYLMRAAFEAIGLAVEDAP